MTPYHQRLQAGAYAATAKAKPTEPKAAPKKAAAKAKKPTT